MGLEQELGMRIGLGMGMEGCEISFNLWQLRRKEGGWNRMKKKRKKFLERKKEKGR